MTLLTYEDVSQRINLDGHGRAKCPAHGGHNRSLAVGTWEDGGLRLHCFSHGCDYGDIINAIKGHSIKGPGTAEPVANTKGQRLYVNQLWREAQPAAGTLIDVYLNSRAITSPPPLSVRYVPALTHWPSGTTHPAMLAAVSTDGDNRMNALHRTYLRTDGNGKADVTPNKMALGPIAGGSFRTAPAGERLVIAEGVEDALTLTQALGLPAWATLGASNLAKVWLPPLPLASEVIVAIDRDAVAEKAAQVAKARLTKEGRKVRLMRPPEGLGIKDFNDVLRARCSDG
jgi:putative DNA primase/helicase